tara:strand:+ start:286 stop:1032 length:747 start_codon:yes stop_codon:yes gene_type:complete
MNTPISKFDDLKEGILIKRYKRFLADIKLDDGREITAHCPNTGPMRGLISESAKVRVSFSSSPSRKLSWTWEQVQVCDSRNSRSWVGINTLIANKLVKKVIEKGLLKDFIGDIDLIRPEMPYGKNKRSRIDFFLTPKSSNPDNRSIFIEVKNTTWIQKNIALFPDTVTLRGQKHLKELNSIMPKSKAILIPCITRTDVQSFTTGDQADPVYASLFRESIKNGLLVLPCCFSFQKNCITWSGIIPLLSK